MGRIGKQAQSEILPADRGGPAQIANGSGEVEPHGGRHRGNPAKHTRGSMRFWNRIWSSARAVARRSRMEREMDAELRFHIEAFTEDSVCRGVPREEAMRRARIEFGGIERAKEECREARGVNFIDSLFEDLRFGLRMLGKPPGFTVVATLTLTLGIGANTAVFGVVNSVLLKPLNYPKAEELVALHQVAPGAAGLADFETGLLLSPSMYFTYAEQNHAFQSLGVWVAGTANVTGLAEPEQVRTVEISDGVLQALGVPPEMGRWLSPADQIPGGPERVMLSYGYWQRRFGGDRSAVGLNLTADSRPREIVGVMPQGFRLVDAEFDLVVPLAFERGKLILAGFGYQGIARLKPGVTPASRSRPDAHAADLDGLLVERAPHRSACLRDVENHAQHSSVEARGNRQRERCPVGRDGNDRIGDADRLRQCSEFIAGKSRGATAGIGGTRGARGGARTHRPGTPRREPDAWAAGWHAWCGVRQWRRAPALSPGSGQLAPSKRDFAGYAGVRIHCTSFAALWFVVRTNSRVEILRVTGFVGSRERGAFDEYEPGAPPRAKRSGGRPGGDGVRAARERRFNDSHVPGIAPSRTGIHGREAPSGTASLHSGFPGKGDSQYLK